MVDAERLKQVMRRYATGVMVLTVALEGEQHALTVNSVTSVSLDPVLLLVCIEKNAQSHDLVKRVGTFALNILSEEQQELGKLFAYDREARRRPQLHAQGHTGRTGALILDDSLGYLECRVVAEFPGGDHTIFVAEVVDALVGATTAGPLLYYASRWIRLSD